MTRALTSHPSPFPGVLPVFPPGGPTVTPIPTGLELLPFFHTSRNSFLPHLLRLVNGTPALVTKTGLSQPSCLAPFFALQIPSYTLGSSADTTHQPSAPLCPRILLPWAGLLVGTS